MRILEQDLRPFIITRWSKEHNKMQDKFLNMIRWTSICSCWSICLQHKNSSFRWPHNILDYKRLTIDQHDTVVVVPVQTFTSCVQELLNYHYFWRFPALPVGLYLYATNAQTCWVQTWSVNSRESTQHIHIQGGKSGISGSKYFQK